MGNLATQTFTSNGTWVAPAGVTQITVIASRPAQSLFSGFFEVTLIDAFGNAYSCGTNSNGILGANLNPGTTGSVSSPVLVVGGLSFQSMAFQPNNANFRNALTTNGHVYSWGANGSGQLGDGTVADKSSPVALVGNFIFTQLASNAGGTIIGLATNGNAYTWGSNSGGRLGNNSAVTGTSSPVAVVGGLTFSQVYATSSAMYGITTAGAMYSWGLGTTGQLGDGTSVSKSSPVAVVGGLSFKLMPIYTGVSNTNALALTTSGAAYAWGANNQGQLGDGTTVAKSSPVLVLGGLTFTQLFSADGTSNYGLTSDGTAYAWGFNNNGQLGVGDVTARSSPVLVLGGLKFSTLWVQGQGNAAQTTVYGLTTTGSLYAWGDNTGGSLGTNQNPGTTAAVSSPVAIVGGLTFIQVNGLHNGSTQGTTGYGVTNGGALYAWGTNLVGQIGDGSTSNNYSSPILVVGSLAPLTSPYSQTTNIAVVPNTSYSINMQQPTPTFGPASGTITTIGVGTPTSVTIYFEE